MVTELDFQPKQPEHVGQLQDQSGAIQPGERPVEIGLAETYTLKDGQSLAMLGNVESHIRKVYAVPVDMTAEKQLVIQVLGLCRSMHAA